METEKPKNLLVLDLDENLIHARETPLSRPADFNVFRYHVYKRPFVGDFLNACSKWYEIGVWSSASDDYVFHVVDNIFPKSINLHFVWGSSKTTLRRTSLEDFYRFGDEIGFYHYRKPLKKLEKFGWKIQNMLIVDDSPEKCALNYGNAVYTQPFEGDLEDRELCYLATYLSTIKDCENYRTFEKRGWKNQTEPMF